MVKGIKNKEIPVHADGKSWSDVVLQLNLIDYANEQLPYVWSAMEIKTPLTYETLKNLQSIEIQFSKHIWYFTNSIPFIEHLNLSILVNLFPF